MEQQYIVSARKYRPMTFDTVVGQRALTTTLKNAILTNRLAHAYLFCGPRGVGKTTCARIFAKTINCEHLDEHGDPCGQCESCRAFDEGRSLCIHELDAASNNSVDDIRELIEQVRIPPQTGKYKVFIIDEVHMLSTNAFNAFLKTLEEPPRFVVFILATTEKHKILPTILSRCQVYDFARITVQSITEHLKYVADKEGYETEEEALSLIAQKADGGMRDALSLFDQMVSFTQGHVTYQATVASLNLVDAEYYFRLVDIVLEKNVESALLLLDEVLGKGFDGGNFVSGLSSHLRNLLVARDARTLPLLEVSETMRQRYHEQAMRCRPQFIYRALRLTNDCDQAYRQSRNKRLQVELCLIEMVQSTDEEGDGAGRRPAKILKPLFSANKVARQPQAQTPKATDSQATAPTPVTKIKTDPKPVPQPAPTTPSASDKKPVKLSADALILAWQHFANKLPPSERATAERMRGITPQLLSADSFLVKVANPFVEKSLSKIRSNIEQSIIDEMGLNHMTMKIEIEKIKETLIAVSKPELFRQMLKDNSSLARMNEIFALELN